jgi:hypothetical protein
MGPSEFFAVQRYTVLRPSCNHALCTQPTGWTCHVQSQSQRQLVMQTGLCWSFVQQMESRSRAKYLAGWQRGFGSIGGTTKQDV